MSEGTAYRLEPTRLETIPPLLSDLVADLALAAVRLDRIFAPATAASLAAAVRMMNCYYSNLIEGHHTVLKDIEAALEDKLAPDEGRRSLQLEALAHIRVQENVDHLARTHRLPEPASEAFLLELHRSFYAGATPQMLRVGSVGKDFQMTPGALRTPGSMDVVVGRHHPPSAEALPSFMGYFAEKFRFKGRGTSERIIAAAIAHHRFNYVHPFFDGNGRVSRLMSHAMALASGIGASGLWSISRGLARGLTDRGEYKRWMDHADMPRQGDLDGRGNLSLRATLEFVEWFLTIALDQVTYMTNLFDREHLELRYERLVATHELRHEATALFRSLLARGALQRGEVAAITGLGDRTARTLIGDLALAGLVGSSSPKGALTLRFPRDAIPTLFPNLYDAQALS